MHMSIHVAVHISMHVSIHMSIVYARFYTHANLDDRAVSDDVCALGQRLWRLRVCMDISTATCSAIWARPDAASASSFVLNI